VLCRLALGNETIDASSFTAIRLLSGAIVLFLIIGVTHKNTKISSKGSWTASFMLFLYALTFSYAYISLDTGTGALILFGSVQITMILLSLVSGTRLHLTEWIGVTMAFTGFVYLILPGVTAPSTTGFFLMSTAGIAWGIYTLKGRDSKNPLMDTGYNFFRTIPLVILLTIITINNTKYFIRGHIISCSIRRYHIRNWLHYMVYRSQRPFFYTSSRASTICPCNCGFWGSYICV